MARHTRIGILIGLLVALPLIGLAGIAIFVQDRQPAVDESELYSATALPFTNEQLTQTAYQLLHDLTAAVDARVQAMHSASLNPTLTPSPTALPGQNTACGWQWATQPNEALSAEIQRRLAQLLTGIDAVMARAEIFGENCVNTDGSVRYFAGMQTDFRVNIRLQSWDDNNPAVQNVLSALSREVLIVLADYPPEDTAGPNPGHIRINFSTASAPDTPVYSLWTAYTEAMTALNQNLSGTALLEALGGTMP